MKPTCSTREFKGPWPGTKCCLRGVPDGRWPCMDIVELEVAIRQIHREFVTAPHSSIFVGTGLAEIEWRGGHQPSLLEKITIVRSPEPTRVLFLRRCRLLLRTEVARKATDSLRKLHPELFDGA